ncbi:hypothetical protein [Azospirillum largimobile]
MPPTYWPRPPLTPPALELQRRYAAHVLLLRGSLPDAEAAIAPSGDGPLRLQNLHDDGTVRRGQELRVEGTFETAPVLALLQGRSIPVRVEYGTEGRAAVFLTVPQDFDTPEEPAAVTLRWPLRSFACVPPLRLAARTVTTAFEIETGLDRPPPVPEDWLSIGRFDRRPVAVEIGETDLAPRDFQWRDGILFAHIPAHTEGGRIRVVTEDGTLHRSHDFFRSGPAAA